MPTTLKFTTPIAIETVLSTGLNSRPSDEGAISAALTVDALLYADFELAVTFGVAPTAGKVCELYLVRQIDGTNDEDYSTSSVAYGPANGYVGAFPVRAVTTAQRIIVPGVLLPSLDFKVLLINRTGQTMAASGNTLKARRSSLQGV